jgi:hypothetical protein
VGRGSHCEKYSIVNSLFILDISLATMFGIIVSHSFVYI